MMVQGLSPQSTSTRKKLRYFYPYPWSRHKASKRFKQLFNFVARQQGRIPASINSVSSNQ